MGKRILVISATPRKGGNSERLCDQFIKGARESGHQAEKVTLRERRIGYCIGCGACYNQKSPCIQRDDAPGIVEKMVAADVIVLATPVYFYSISGQLKTLLDRTCAGYTRISDKEFYFILTAADNDPHALQPAVECLRGFTSCLRGAKECGILYGTGEWQLGDVEKTDLLKQAQQMGRQV